MSASARYSRLNLYLDHPDLREKIKVAAARRGVSLSSYCLEAIRDRLAEDGYLRARRIPATPRSAAAALDRLRQRVGPVGVPARDLIAEGRNR